MFYTSLYLYVLYLLPQGNIVLNDRMISAIPVSPRKVVVKREHSYSSNHHHLAAAKSSALLLTNEPGLSHVPPYGAGGLSRSILLC